MTTYKYLAYKHDGEEPDREIYMDGLLDDSHAVDKAKEDEEAIIDGETGDPFVYREADTSWILVSPKELK